MSSQATRIVDIHDTIGALGICDHFSLNLFGYVNNMKLIISVMGWKQFCGIMLKSQG